MKNIKGKVPKAVPKAMSKAIPKAPPIPAHKGFKAVADMAKKEFEMPSFQDVAEGFSNITEGIANIAEAAGSVGERT